MKRIRPDRCRGASDSRLPSPIPARVYRTLDEVVKRRYHPIPPRYEHLPAFCLFLYAVAAVCLILLIIQSGSVAFSDWFNLHISAPLRAFLAALTAPLPFSLGEFTVLLLPLVLVVTLRHAIRRRCDSWRTAGVFIGVLISVLLSFFSQLHAGCQAGTGAKAGQCGRSCRHGAHPCPTPERGSRQARV